MIENPNGVLNPLLNQSFNEDRKDVIKERIPLSQLEKHYDLEKEKSFHLPEIVKTVDNPPKIKNNDYKDSNIMNASNVINTTESVLSFNNRKQSGTNKKSKSQCPKRKSQISNKHHDIVTLDFEDACLSKYIKKFSQKQK